nr:zinc finger BED domain-containing protein RICESLEEPER 2-like [Tanacetum cinerariifolium]
MNIRTYYKRVYDQEDIFDLDEDQVEDDESDDSLWKTTVRLVLNILYDLFYEYKDNIGTLQSENFQECLKKRKLDDAGNVPTETELDRYLNEDTVKYDDDDLDILLWWKNNTETFSVLSKLQRMFWLSHCQPNL